MTQRTAKIRARMLAEKGKRDAKSALRSTGRAISHGADDNPYFAAKYLKAMTVAGKRCPCGHLFDDTAGNSHAWTHFTSSDCTFASVHEKAMMSMAASPATTRRTLTGFWGPVTATASSSSSSQSPPALSSTSTAVGGTACGAGVEEAGASGVGVVVMAATGRAEANDGGDDGGDDDSVPEATVHFRCMHFRPVALQNIDVPAEYPWRLHSLDDKGASIATWDAVANGSFAARACSLTTTTAGGACAECAELQYNPGLKSTIETMLGDVSKRSESPGIVTMTGRADLYCSLTVMADRRTALKVARDSESLALLAAHRKLAKMDKALSVHKRLVMPLEQSDVPKLRQTLGTALASGVSMSKLLEKLQDTIEGKYRARGDYSSTQYDVVSLLVRLGGPKPLFALARPLGLPSLMDWQRHWTDMVTLWAGAGLGDLKATIKHNLIELFGDLRLEEFQAPEKKAVWALLVDEIAINPEASYTIISSSSSSRP